MPKNVIVIVNVLLNEKSINDFKWLRHYFYSEEVNHNPFRKR